MKEPGEEATVHVSSIEAGTYIAEIQLNNHPGLVFHPKHIVGVTGDIRLRTRWEFFNPHSWLSGWFRFIIFHGTGRIFVEGQEGVVGMAPCGKEIRVEEPLLMGFDMSLNYGIVRTETFWPYLKDRTRLFDLSFEGDGFFFLQIAPDNRFRQKSPAEKIFSVFSSTVQVIGKFFGF